MKDFVDRQSTKAGRRKITYEDGRSEFVTVEIADQPTVEGTALNREAFMALQGFEETYTVFNPNGSITETNVLGESLTTVFNPDGSIAEIFTNKDGLSVEKMTVFNADGSITTSLVEA